MIVDIDRIKKHLSNVYESDKDIVADCPKCGKHEFRISKNKQDHPFLCNRKNHCGWSGNIYTFFSYFGEELPTKPIVIESMKMDIGGKKQEVMDIYLDEIRPPIGYMRLYDHWYLNGRGFKKEDYHKYEVGKVLLKDYYVYWLVYMNFRLVGWVGRRIEEAYWVIDGKQVLMPKFDNSETDFKKALYGYDLLRGESAILVEGILDHKAICEKVPEIPSVCTFGAKISDEQIELLKLKGVKDIYFMHETDALKDYKRNAIKLDGHFNVRCCDLGGADPDEASEEQIRNAMLNWKSPLAINLDLMKNGLQK